MVVYNALHSTWACSSGEEGDDDSEGEGGAEGEQAIGWDGTKQPKTRRRSSKAAKLKHQVIR